MNAHPLFGNIDFKDGVGGKGDFPRMRIVIKDEICHLGLDTKKYSPKDGGIHLTPKQTHELITKNKDLVILDTRNDYEAKIGTFKNAIIPPIQNFRDLPEYIDSNLEQFKDKDVLMFCTGGVRCERATTYLKSKNVAKHVYQIEGGIHRYIEQFPDGYFRGKNYVFDERIAVKANDDILGTCDNCGISIDDYTNCINAECNKHYLSCQTCLKELQNCCSTTCHQLVSNRKVVIRTKPLPGIQYKNAVKN